MSAKGQPKSAIRSRRAKPQPGVLAMLLVPGDPAAVLREMELPAGAKVAIVSSSPETVERIRGGGKRRFGSVRKVYTSEQPPPAESAVVNQAAFTPDARARAILEGVRIAQEDLQAAGGAFNLEEVRTLLRGISRQAVDKRVQEGSLLAVPGPSHHRSFPTLQFNRDGTVVEGLKEVRAALPSRNPWTVLNFLAQPDDRLRGRRPIDLLKAGEVAPVVEAARRVGQQGA